MDPQKITGLASLLRQNGDKILNSEFTFTLSAALLRALNDSFTLIANSTDLDPGPLTQSFRVVKPYNSTSPVFRDLQLVYDFIQKTPLLCIVYYPGEENFGGRIDISIFHALKRLEVHKTDIRQVVGIQPLRAQLRELICVRSLVSVGDIITLCGGDNSNGFVWNELKVADFSYNNLQTVDSSLEFAQYLQHLNLRHNNLHSVEALKWLPHLKTLDLSYNRLQCIPQLHMEACKRIQALNISNNFVEDLMGVAKLDALTDLDLSDNCLLDHSCLLPLSELLTLKFLNLYGNPLYCHPKHRLATAQFLHNNTATVKFILDLEPLSKSEKAITGSQQLRHVGSLSRYTAASLAASINSDRRTPSTHTPASSVGSLVSFKFQETSDVGAEAAAVVAQVYSAKKRASRIRTVVIEDEEDLIVSKANEKQTAKQQPPEPSVVDSTNVESMQSKISLNNTPLAKPNSDHLEAKQHIKTLREKYGAEWLQSGNAEMMQSVLGIDSSTPTRNADLDRDRSRQLFNDYLGEFSTTALDESVSANALEAPAINETGTVLQVNTTSILTHNGQTRILHETDHSANAASGNANENNHIQPAYSNLKNEFEQPQTETETEENDIQKQQHEKYEDNATSHLESVYSSTLDDEPAVSDVEDEEAAYIVYTSDCKESFFLTLSPNFLREKDALTQKTKTKWSLKILESCDRLKSNSLRINFDTVKIDKQERIYVVEDGLCQELESKLRDILSQRDLSEMNQTIYCCVICSCQFSRENKYTPHTQDVSCPDCKSTFVAEMREIPRSLEKPVTAKATAADDDLNLSPAAIVEESPVTLPLLVSRQEESVAAVNVEEETGSIERGPTTSRLTAINTQRNRRLLQAFKSSVNSLNESSSCSKITHSQSSFDSNQSLMGSSTTERDREDFNCESDVDILSNPSQSSIEVLDQIMHHNSRKTSEERRISQIPNLETIDDQSYTQSNSEFDKSLMERLIEPAEIARKANEKNCSGGGNGETVKHTSMAATTKAAKEPPTASALNHLNLTESSSSGSITDSICTAYEHQASNIDIHSTLVEENGDAGAGDISGSLKESNAVAMKREDTGISSMFRALFQSTNILMSSSKNLQDAQPNANTKPSARLASSVASTSTSAPICKPYKFNYTDFNDIDHRLKLHFYQTKFDEAGEHFKWIARGQIYNEQTRLVSDGLVVMSTCKCYLLEAFAPEHDEVTKWLRHVASVTVDRLEKIRLLPWKLGLAFELRDWGGFLLLLQDILRTDSLLLYFANNTLPANCQLEHQPSKLLMRRLSAAIDKAQLQMCALLSGCEVQCEGAQRTFKICGLLTTKTHIYVTSEKLAWLSLQSDQLETDVEVCVTQLMNNLVEVERCTESVFVLNFLDEVQGKCELWKCTFVTQENAECCLNAIGQSWEQVFGVPLLYN